MSENSLLDKVWRMHEVRRLPDGNSQLFIGLHLIHEVTSPQAFQMLRERNLKVLFSERTFATADHIIPTDDRSRPLKDSLAEAMLCSLEKNCSEFGIQLYSFGSKNQGIVHVIGPELGLTQPGMAIACGDSHTSTHGAFGTISFGIGTTQVRDVLATQCMFIEKPKLRKIEFNGKLQNGVYAKDVILEIIRRLGVKGGIGFAYEYAGSTFESMSLEERMTVCNMSIEGGARAGYVNPDEKTFNYLEGKPFAPKNFGKATEFWKSIASDKSAKYDDVVKMDASRLEPVVTWGTNPGQAVGITESIPFPKDLGNDAKTAEDSLKFMEFTAGTPIDGTKIDVAFIGSCTNSRLSDLREAAKIVEGKKVFQNIKALVVPGSNLVKLAAEKEGLDKIFSKAGFQWREAGCSMCLAMNPDKLIGRQICASSSNRNFIGRQGSPEGRTLLMSPAMVAAAAIHGKVVDVRKEF